MKANYQMKFSTMIIILLSAVVIQGCASLADLFSRNRQLEVTVVSQPAGASIYYKDKYKGVAPQTLYFSIDEEERGRGYLPLGEVKAVWPSGATDTRSSENFDITNGLSWKFTMIRPANAPNPDVDYRNANDFERNQIEREKLKRLKERDELSQREELFQREGGEGRERAASLCQSLTFSSDRDDCMRIVRNARFFSGGAVSVCRSLMFTSDKQECLRVAANREYLKADIQTCKNKMFASQKIDCLRRGR
jgi:hypothetical protein